MPSYDYKCNKCGRVQEESHVMAGPDKPIVCKKCRSKNIKKMVCAPYVKFIGEWQTNSVRKTS